LVELFQKLARVEGANPSSPSADGEIPQRRFSFDNFSFCACGVKKKSG
jgi:hypothetical protein